MKFIENRLKGSGDMERTQSSRVDPLTLICTYESRSLGHVLCTPSYLEKHMSDVS